MSIKAMHNARQAISFVRDAMETISRRAHRSGYDWNADPMGLTLLEGESVQRMNAALVALSGAMDWRSQIDESAIEPAARKLRRLRLTIVGGRKEHPGETVHSALARGLGGLYEKDVVAFILRFAVKYYLEAIGHEGGREMQKTATGLLNFSVKVFCPHCKRILDLTEAPYNEQEDELGLFLFGKDDTPADWAGVDMEYTCNRCLNKFRLMGIEY